MIKPTVGRTLVLADSIRHRLSQARALRSRSASGSDGGTRFNELQECGGQAKEGQAEERILQRLGGTKRRFANQEVTSSDAGTPRTGRKKIATMPATSNSAPIATGSMVDSPENEVSTLPVVQREARAS